MAVLNTVFVFYESSTKNQCFTFSFLISFFSFSLSYFGVLLYFCTGIGKKISKMNRRTMKVGSMMALNVSLLVMVFSMGVLAPAIAQNKQNRKPRKKLKELLMKADSLRLHLRQSADRGCMLQWGDSLLMAELGKGKMSEKKKQRFMKHYVKIQRRLSLYDRQLFRGDTLLAANYYKIKYDTSYISRPNARWTIKLRGNLSGADLETTAKTDGMERIPK